MSKHSAWLIALVMVGLAVVVATTAAYFLLPPQQMGDVAVPPRDATPEQVVTAYLDALNAHDCDTAAALTVAGAEGGARWCRDVASLKNVDVRDHFMEVPEYSGHSAPDEVAHVPVSFDVDWRPFHNDGSMGEGATTWGYLLVRGSVDAPWRIFDQGVG